jgi:hypothetical protein
MKKFIVIYHVNNDAMKKMTTATPEEMKEGMDGWMTWAQKCGDKLIDMGAPLMGGQLLTPDGKSTDSTKGVNGFSILQAENMEDAKALLQGHPHLAWDAGCTIEVHETMPLPGM